MISFLIWLLTTLFGAVLGYGFSWLTGMNLYLCVGIGIILGNSAGVTANIHRSREIIEFKSGSIIEVSEADTDTSQNELNPSPETNQKAP